MNETTEKNMKKNIKKRKINYDFSKYEIIKKKEGLTLYNYSSFPRTQMNKLVYQYFYDKYQPNDYSKAYVVLFCGKTGDGKTTSINAFFNIIKGIKLFFSSPTKCHAFLRLFKKSFILLTPLPNNNYN